MNNKAAQILPKSPIKGQGRYAQNGEEKENTRRRRMEVASIARLGVLEEMAWEDMNSEVDYNKPKRLSEMSPRFWSFSIFLCRSTNIDLTPLFPFKLKKGQRGELVWCGER
jgi:hypothetical protein